MTLITNIIFWSHYYFSVIYFQKLVLRNFVDIRKWALSSKVGEHRFPNFKFLESLQETALF